MIIPFFPFSYSEIETYDDRYSSEIYLEDNPDYFEIVDNNFDERTHYLDDEFSDHQFMDHNSEILSKEVDEDIVNLDDDSILNELPLFSNNQDSQINENIGDLLGLLIGNNSDGNLKNNVLGILSNILMNFNSPSDINSNNNGNVVATESEIDNLIECFLVDCIGTDDADIMVGSFFGESIFGRDGDDIIQSNGGDDQIFGEEGDDYLLGGGGSDFIVGGKGDDFLSADSGTNFISGGGGSTLLGNQGDDKLFGGADNDFFVGGKGSDYFDCNEGTDTIIDYDPNEDTKLDNCEFF